MPPNRFASPMTPILNGGDYSLNPPSLPGSLLQTVAADGTRLGHFIQAQSTTGLTMVLDDQAGANTATVIVLAGAPSAGGQEVA